MAIKIVFVTQNKIFGGEGNANDKILSQKIVFKQTPIFCVYYDIKDIKKRNHREKINKSICQAA